VKKTFRSERLVLDEISEIGNRVRHLMRGLSIGQLIAMIRKQLGMSQKILSARAKIPQSTLSRVEQNKWDPNVSTLKKILHALSCDLGLVPILREPIDVQRRNQARRIAEKHVRYLKGTMSLEKQEPDPRFLEDLQKEKEEEMLHSNKMLWEHE
jgi:transcriptional regulator with XRE-family HTH domain